MTDYLRAVLAHGRDDRQQAIALYESSLQHADNAWALRGLAAVAGVDGRLGAAAEYALAAARLAPGEWRLAAEAVGRLLDAGRSVDALALVDELPAEFRCRGRLRLLEGWAAHGAGEASRAQAVLEDGLEIADLREGERSLDQLWEAVFPDRAVPDDYDFRMVTKEASR